MQIKDMFEKDIERDIKGVIKVGQKDEENIYQELDEYVVTNELLKHFTKFFSNYSKGIQTSTDDIGVWISGFFGSGKSHFLKILSYILDSNLEVKGRRPIDFFKEDGKIKDRIVIGDMESSTSVSSDVILFNIDSKSSSQSNSDKDDILNVFIKVFNEMRGYCGGMPFLANFEKKLDEENKFDEFKDEFKNINGSEWIDARDDYYFIQDDIIQAIVNIGFMSEREAINWSDNAEENTDLSIENFAKEVKQYCMSKGKNHHVIFLVDEVGQYIADDTKLMLNLQTIVEELGINCNGKVLVVVTSQQNIDDITKSIKGRDFSKIQGRFKTRLSLSSSNVDEVIRRRILAKTDVAQQSLEAEYINVEPILKNIITFEKSKVEMKTYENAKDFANIYPFVPYQFNRVQDVLTSIREHSASGKHMADGERSMLALFQESAIEIKDAEEGQLVPFNIFYNAIEQFIDHTHSQVINKARTNNYLLDFDVEVLKILFMVKYVKEIKATSKNITTLMISNINEDRLELNSKVDKSLKRLQEQTLIQKNGEVYSFLTNEEQDINREIKNEMVDPGEILDATANKIFAEIYPKKKYNFSTRYNFQFNQAIDDKKINKGEFDIGMRIITPFYESNLIDYGQDSFGEGNMHNILKGLSESNNEVIIHLTNQSSTVFDEIRESLQIQKFLTKRSIDLKANLRARKQQEYNDQIERIKLFLESAIKDATIYVKGDKVDIPVKNIETRLDEAMGRLVDKVYNKLNYMDFAPDKSDIKEALNQEYENVLITKESDCINALNDLEEYISNQFKISNVITLKNLLQRYSKAPYGFNHLDVQWLVATLFAQKRVTLTLNSNELSINDVGVQKILEYLTKTEFFEKLIISFRKSTPKEKIKIVKEVLRECYDLNISFDNDEKIMREFKKANNLKLNEIEMCLSEFKIFNKYPGEKTLHEAKELFTDANNKQNILQFFNFVSKKEDYFIDVSEDLEPILAFFEGNQKAIFQKSCNIYEIYENNVNLVNDSILSEKASEINKIIQMPNPYSHIRKLPELNDDFNVRFDEILVEKKEIIENDINNDLNDVLSRLNSEELKNKFENKVNFKFSSLKDKLNTEKNIAIIQGITTESKNLREVFIDKIKNFVSPVVDGDSGAGGEDPIDEISINIKKITNSSRVKLESDEEIDILLNKITTKLKEELKNYDIIYLEL